MSGIKLNLQMFAEDSKESKTFTQEEIDKIVTERLLREKKSYEKQIEELTTEHQKELAKYSDNKEKELYNIEIEKAQKQNKALIEEIKALKKAGRKADVLTMYTKDELPCIEEFSDLVGLIADVEDDDDRAKLYTSFKKYTNAILQKAKIEATKGKVNPTSGGATVVSDSSNNPFTTNNLTEIISSIHIDKEKAEEMAKLSGQYEKYKYLFK